MHHQHTATDCERPAVSLSRRWYVYGLFVLPVAGLVLAHFRWEEADPAGQSVAVAVLSLGAIVFVQVVRLLAGDLPPVARFTGEIMLEIAADGLRVGQNFAAWWREDARRRRRIFIVGQAGLLLVVAGLAVGSMLGDARPRWHAMLLTGAAVVLATSLARDEAARQLRIRLRVRRWHRLRRIRLGRPRQPWVVTRKRHKRWTIYLDSVGLLAGLSLMAFMSSYYIERELWYEVGGFLILFLACLVQGLRLPRAIATDVRLLRRLQRYRLSRSARMLQSARASARGARERMW